MTLLEETTDLLSRNNHKPSDVEWCGSADFGWFDWDTFAKLADKDYDHSYGSPKVCQDLLVVGSDFWLERHEYDGSEWWEYKATPIKPSVQRIPRAIVDDDFMWKDLAEVNPAPQPPETKEDEK